MVLIFTNIIKQIHNVGLMYMKCIDIGISISEKMEMAIDRAVQIGLIKDLGEFIRIAIINKLEKVGIGIEKTSIPRELTEKQRNTLREIANIGAGSASTMLSEAIGHEVRLKTLTFNIISLEKLSWPIGVSRKLIVSVFTSIGGGALGNIILVFPLESACLVVDMIEKTALGTTRQLTSRALKIFKRVNLSLIKCYIDAIARFLEISIQSEELRLIGIYSDTIIDLVDLSMKEKLEHVFMLKTELSVKPDVEGEFYFLLKESFISLLPTEQRAIKLIISEASRERQINEKRLETWSRK